jgi:hypothetical protein
MQKLNKRLHIDGINAARSSGNTVEMHERITEFIKQFEQQNVLPAVQLICKDDVGAQPLSPKISAIVSSYLGRTTEIASRSTLSVLKLLSPPTMLQTHLKSVNAALRDTGMYAEQHPQRPNTICVKVK